MCRIYIHTKFVRQIEIYDIIVDVLIVVVEEETDDVVEVVEVVVLLVVSVVEVLVADVVVSVVDDAVSVIDVLCVRFCVIGIGLQISLKKSTKSCFFFLIIPKIRKSQATFFLFIFQVLKSNSRKSLVLNL